MTFVFCAPATARTIIDEWNNVKPGSVPSLKPVTVDPKSTALLVMDLLKGTCNDKRPRCLATIPKIKALIAKAEAKGVTVIWTRFPGSKAEDILPEVAPASGTTIIDGLADKFLDTHLAGILKDRRVRTLIPVGTLAEGAVLYTASDAAMQGARVVVPVDGLSSVTLYGEQSTVWLLANAPTVQQNVTLTKTDMITFR